MNHGAPRPALIDQVASLCREAGEAAGGRCRSEADEMERRLAEPLRLAIAGRVKAGKSTLLNALIGERLAATDAGECTRVVTWYRHGTAYEVAAVLRDGTRRELRFRREDGALEIDLGSLAVDEVERLEVSWPAERLNRFTLVDTPGLESLDADRSHRTRVLLGIDEPGHSQVDAVIYLMRHLHRSDAEFLEAFMDGSLARPSPVNAVAVLSRADEIGAGRLDALDSATAIAGRYAADPMVQSWCATVVPVAGLIAETGATLREDEAARLRDMAGLDPGELEEMLLSVDRFTAPGVSPLTSEYRRDLIVRLGLFGVRLCLGRLRADPGLTASALAAGLLATSGVDRLIDVLETDLGPRSSALQARSALVGLRALAGELETEDPVAATRLQAGIERVESGAHELAELHLLHLVLTGQVVFPEDRMREITRLTTDGEPWERMGLGSEAGHEEVRAAAVGGIERWRTAAAHPLSDRVTVDACEIVVRCYERLYAEVSTR